MKTGHARRRCTPNLLDHSPARGGVIALIIFLGARPEGVSQLLISLRELSQIPLKNCEELSLFLPHMQEKNPQLCNTPEWCVVSLGSSGVSSIAFSPLSQDFCGVSREEVGVPKKTTLLTGWTWRGILGYPRKAGHSVTSGLPAPEAEAARDGPPGHYE
jgi:hypothetical protein